MCRHVVKIVTRAHLGDIHPWFSIIDHQLLDTMTGSEVFALTVEMSPTADQNIQRHFSISNYLIHDDHVYFRFLRDQDAPTLTTFSLTCRWGDATLHEPCAQLDSLSSSVFCVNVL